MTQSTPPQEHVLVVPTLLFHELGHFQGFHDDVSRYLETLLDPAHTRYMPRDEAEKDPSYKQLIPYCIFRCGDDIFAYTRGTAQGETRLHSKRSIGVGGHISTLDLNQAQEPYLAGMDRELDEEVSIETRYQEELVGMINDDETEVGRVHLGIVHIFDVELPQVLPREKSMIGSGFVPLAQLVSERDQFETWSQICLDYLHA
jgi:predicted NUDIX family phosphoesterase